MTNEKFMQVFRDLDVWLKQTSGFGEKVDDNYDFKNGDVHESYISIFVRDCKTKAVVRNRCNDSIKAGHYCGDNIEIHNEYVEVTSGVDNDTLETYIIPYDTIALIVNNSMSLDPSKYEL